MAKGVCWVAALVALLCIQLSDAYRRELSQVAASKSFCGEHQRPGYAAWQLLHGCIYINASCRIAARRLRSKRPHCSTQLLKRLYPSFE
jgi:hypothetical protein